MAQVLLDLGDYKVTDSGVVAANWNRLFEHIRAEKPMVGLSALPSEHVEIYNRRRGRGNEIPIVELDDILTGPPVDSYIWQIPPQYHELDLVEYLVAKLVQMFPEPSPQYTDRLDEELRMMEERQMSAFLRVLIYMVDVFEHHGVVHGVGRGSSCASLVLFLIGIHMVDPIVYEIPITEFLR